MEPNYRRCIVCRATAPKAKFLQVVRQPTGAISINQGAGRSAYICPTPACLGLSHKKKRLERALKSAILPEIYSELWSCITEHSQEQKSVKALRDVS
jgi:uncharacterized protein